MKKHDVDFRAALLSIDSPILEIPSIRSVLPCTCHEAIVQPDGTVGRCFELCHSCAILLIMANTRIDERFICATEARAAQQASLGVKVRYEDIGERLMELRKIAWDRYGATALWYVPPHATYSTMEEVADGLRSNGDLEAAYLAAAIIREIDSRTGRAA